MRVLETGNTFLKKNTHKKNASKFARRAISILSRRV